MKILPENAVSSFFYYMWNTWSEEECKIIFKGMYKHFWMKWNSLAGKSLLGAAERFYAELSTNNREQLVNTSLQLYEPCIFALDKGLFKEGMSNADTHGISYDDFVEFGRRIGLTDRVIKQEIKMFQELNPKAIELIKKSFLSDDLKKQYIKAYKYRCKMLNL